MRLWELREVEGDHIIAPTVDLRCPLCNEPLLLHDFRAYRASQGFFHVDVHMKCPKCSLWLTFGVPIDREEFDKLRRSKYHDKILLWEVLRLAPISEEVAKRLERWGYW